MIVTGSDQVHKVLDLILSKVGKDYNATKSAIIKGNVDTTGIGLEVQSPWLTELNKKFMRVPDFERPDGSNLVIKGPLMGGEIEETAEI